MTNPTRASTDTAKTSWQISRMAAIFCDKMVSVSRVADRVRVIEPTARAEAVRGWKELEG